MLIDSEVFDKYVKTNKEQNYKSYHFLHESFCQDVGKKFNQ